MDKCLNVIIYYDNRDEVEMYISEIQKNAGDKVDICLVINKDTYNLANSMVSKIRDELTITILSFDFAKNIGYFNALLVPIRELDIRNYKYIILSNTDIRYVTKNFFQLLMNKKYGDHVGCIAPSVYEIKTNSYANPHYMNRIAISKLKRNIVIFSHPFLAKVYLKIAGFKAKNTKKEEKQSCVVYAPHGCYMIFTRKFISKILTYEYGGHLYSEEACVGELLLKNEMECFYDNTIKVIHDANSITGSMKYKMRFKLWADSLKYIVKEFY